jgi:Cu/Ag efflux pump CusA
VGTSVVGGMLFSTLLNVVIIPVLYVVVRSTGTGRSRRAPAARGAAGGSHA